MDIRLQSLRLRNFKGVRDFTLELTGQSATVHAANAVGKTSLADAASWLLFEKDSLGRKDFGIKTINPVTGEATPMLEHEVEAEFTVNGSPVVFRRLFKEKWVKPRGASSDVFSGHETQHFIDDVPMSKGEFTDRLSEIVEESTWRMLSDPNAFQSMHWQDRRRVLLEVCGDVTDQDVIDSDPELADLADILGNRTLEDHRKVIAASRTKVNNEIQHLPTRIDEVTRTTASLTTDTQPEIEARLAPLQAQRSNLESELAALKAGTADGATERRELREVEDALSQLDRDARREAQDQQDEHGRKHAELVRAAMAKVVDATLAVDSSRRQLDALAGEPARIEQLIQDCEATLAGLREEWFEVDARKLEAHAPDTCAACKQKLPGHQVEAANTAALEQLNLKKAADLESINARGERTKTQVATHTEKLAETHASIEQLQQQVTAQEAALADAQAAVATAEATPVEQAKTVDAASTPEYTALASKRDALTKQLAALAEGDATESTAALQADLQTVTASINELQGLLQQVQQRAAAEARIAELMDHERELAAQAERLEYELYLTEVFIRQKVTLLESRINERFDTVRFQLFRQQVNGGLEEVCEATVNGVPYPSLNHAAKVQAGMEIIRTLQAHHDIHAPVWVDSRESVSTLPALDAQVISLHVSPADKTFRIETEKDLVAA